MRTLFKILFVQNWQRKLISVGVAVVVWLAVNHSLTSTKTLSNIPVRLVNIPAGKTVEGMQSNGVLAKRITLSLSGNKNTLNELSSDDLEVVIDASDKADEWIASIGTKNLISMHPEIDISKAISRVTHQSFILRTAKLITEKIPVLITRPIGEAPRDYQFLDVWPYKLNLTVAGPEEVVKELKAKGLKLTFNLNDINKSHLDSLNAQRNVTQGDVVSYFVPEQWKQFALPHLSDAPIEINDPQAKALRIDFIRSNLLPVDKPIPLSLFVPPEYSSVINPENLKIDCSSFIHKKDGLYLTTTPLCAKGVGLPFLKTVRDMLQIVVIVTPKTEEPSLEWSLQFINPRLLEDRYVSMLITDITDDEIRDLQPLLREEYLRNRFRSYMNRFQLSWPDDSRLDLKIELKGNTVFIKEK